MFDDGEFHHQNNIAKELYALEEKFFTGATKKQTLQQLAPYYTAIRTAATQIPSHAEKQTFLKVIYENFYKVYNPKAADRLGVIYTPNEIVRFMIESADWLCEKHFGKNLIDKGVEILDPATGTGTFICELLEHFRGSKQKLAYKYKEELHANEVAILPYYVANLNIETTYYTIGGQYAEFENLCFVDTLDNIAALTVEKNATTSYGDLFGALSDENVKRIKRQNSRKISVVIGNPPYNAWQENYNDANPNRYYARIDRRIAETYVRNGTSQNQSSVYDMYTRFIRWASDRLRGEGIIALIVGRKPISKGAYNGFRCVVADEFEEIWIVDLGGDVIENPKLSGTKHNVFGIKIGVSIIFFVRKKKHNGCRIKYARCDEYASADEKLAFLAKNSLHSIEFESVAPDERFDWINQAKEDWGECMPLIDSANRKKATQRISHSVFQIMSSGLQTKQDEWAFDIEATNLKTKMTYLIGAYNTATSLGKDKAPRIKWHRELDKRRKSGKTIAFSEQKIRPSNYRPFAKRYAYFDVETNSQSFRLHEIFREQPNRTITFLSVASSNPLAVLAASDVFDTCLLKSGNGSTQGVPFNRYTSDGSRLDNITDWALDQFRAHYESAATTLSQRESAAAEQPREGLPTAGKSRARKTAPQAKAGKPLTPVLPTDPRPKGEGSRAITKDAIFHYVYAVLHDPIYRDKYALNLKREFPRIPFYKDFWRWADWGQRFMALHIGYESVEPWPLTRTDAKDEKAARAGVAPKTILKADKVHGVIVLDSETQLAGVPASAWEYRLGNRSGLEWILDQYKEKTPKDPTIREKFNTYRFKDYKEKVVDLLMRVTRVSVETMEIVEAMKTLERE